MNHCKLLIIINLIMTNVDGKENDSAPSQLSKEGKNEIEAMVVLDLPYDWEGPKTFATASIPFDRGSSTLCFAFKVEAMEKSENIQILQINNELGETVAKVLLHLEGILEGYDLAYLGVEGEDFYLQLEFTPLTWVRSCLSFENENEVTRYMQWFPPNPYPDSE